MKRFNTKGRKGTKEKIKGFTTKGTKGTKGKIKGFKTMEKMSWKKKSF